LAKQRVGVRLDLLAFKRIDRGDDQLDARPRFEIGKLGFDRAARIG
jgi:hypothetical protein